MKVKTIAIINIVLGVLIIASFMCPSLCSSILFGALVLAFGIVLLVKPKKK
jgi:uncharacterized membrane protein HdeD (DUF308 family)